MDVKVIKMNEEQLMKWRLMKWRRELNSTLGFLKKVGDSIDNNLKVMECENEVSEEEEKEKERVYVPKEIWISSDNISSTSVIIMNDVGQGLYGMKNEKSYRVDERINKNNGRNYYLDCVEKDERELESGVLYFCTNEKYYGFGELRDLTAYRILLKDDDFCFWDEVPVYSNYMVVIEGIKSKRYFYKIMREE